MTGPWTLPAGVIQDAPQDEEDSSSDSDSDDSGHIVDSDATVTLLDDELWMFAGDSDATVSYDSDGNEWRTTD